MNLRRLMQNCPSRTKPTRGQSCASQQKFAADGRDGSIATEPFGDRSDLCPLLSQERQFEAWVWKVAKGYKQTLKRRKSLPAKVCNDWAGAGYCFEVPSRASRKSALQRVKGGRNFSCVPGAVETEALPPAAMTCRRS